MRWVAFFVLFVTLAGGCVLEDKPVDPGIDGGVDGSVDAGPCGSCPVDKPACNDEVLCAQCTADDDAYCAERALVCNTEASTCVECLESLDCNDPSEARCNTERNECVGCESDDDCNGIDGLPRCQADTCVQCTPAMEEADCGGKSCDPATFACTTTGVGSVETCEECVADSECKEVGNRCVAMTYQGDPYPDMQTGFCLKTFTMGDPCEQPYFVPLLGRESLSGPPAANFCGIDEANVACPAVLALLNNVECPSGEDTECPESGLCRDFVDGLAANRCTYRCGDAAECKKPPVAGSTCDSSVSGSDNYCGG